MAKKCPRCKSQNTEVWGTGGILKQDWEDVVETRFRSFSGRAYYCHNCGNAFD